MVHLFEKVKSLFDAYLLIGGLDMASIFFNGEKAEKQTAINEMLVHISNYFDGRFEVIVNSDDTGTHLEVQVEMDDVNSHIESLIQCERTSSIST